MLHRWLWGGCMVTWKYSPEISKWQVFALQSPFTLLSIYWQCHGQDSWASQTLSLHSKCNCPTQNVDNTARQCMENMRFEVLDTYVQCRRRFPYCVRGVTGVKLGVPSMGGCANILTLCVVLFGHFAICCNCCEWELHWSSVGATARYHGKVEGWLWRPFLLGGKESVV